MSWISAGDASYELLRQANALARRLGHDLQPWRLAGERETARCNACGDEATVAARSFGRSPLAGPALTFRCRPRPAYVRGAGLSPRS